MPRNGSGTYSLPAGNPVVTSTTISSTVHNNTMSDIATAITGSLPRNGEAPPTANLPMGGYKLTGLAIGSDSTDSATFGQTVNQPAAVTLASAATVNIGAELTTNIVISGTTTITAFDSVAAGIKRDVTFSGALTLTHNATSLILPGGANITTTAGDCATFLSLGSGNWRCIKYQYATASAFRAALSIDLHGQCRLTKSGSNLLLSPHNGNKLVINGVQYAVPAAGVSLAPTSLAANTTYYIYAYMNAGTMTLEASATAHATDATTGVEIKSGDATRTLVGMARTTAGTAWADTAAQRFVISYFNRKAIYANQAIGSTRSTASPTFTELSSADRAEFLSWADEAVSAGYSTSASNNTVGSTVISCIGIDSTFTPSSQTRFVQLNAGGAEFPISGSGAASVTDGYHYVSLLGAVSANTGSWTTVGGVWATTRG